MITLNCKRSKSEERTFTILEMYDEEGFFTIKGKTSSGIYYSEGKGHPPVCLRTQFGGEDRLNGLVPDNEIDNEYEYVRLDMRRPVTITIS